MNKRITYLILIFLSTILTSKAQLAPNTYWIQFTDKNGTDFSLYHPDQYLSLKSIERRIRYSIPYDSLDIPVNSSYLDSLVKRGATIVHTSKWLNGAAIYTEDPSILSDIYALNFVDESVSTGSVFAMNLAPRVRTSNITELNANYYDYGTGNNQINLHHGQALHNNGYRGQGMLIAIIDAGFQNLNQVPAFDSLFINHQIIGTWDFVSNDTNVYDDHYHGKAVLSTIAANLPGELMGTAPKANFLLLRSENASSEYKIEEINWVAAAEYADSIGVDIITTSLGYNNYSSPSTSYTWDDIDGETAPITRATDIAFSRGIFMVTSAGNEGTKAWKKITCPADAKNALTVGACNSNGDYASFSSRGYSKDGRIKPDVMAQGASTAVITSSTPTTGNGTSFSTPLTAGLVACLWQVNKSKSNLDILNLIKKYSSQFSNPDSIMGYGIPNFEAAYNDLSQNIEAVKVNKNQILNVYPTIFDQQVTIKYYSVQQSTIKIEMISINGNLILEKDYKVDSNQVNNIEIKELGGLRSGAYLLRIISDDFLETRKIIKS